MDMSISHSRPEGKRKTRWRNTLVLQWGRVGIFAVATNNIVETVTALGTGHRIFEYTGRLLRNRAGQGR